MSGILNKYNDLRVISDKNRAILEQKNLFAMDQQALMNLGIENPGLGYIVLKDCPGDPNAVMEVVINGAMKDSFTTLFVGHPVFNNRQGYMDARAELIQLINDFGDAGEAGVAIKCPGRNRKVHTRDLGLQQLIDLVKFVVNRATK